MSEQQAPQTGGEPVRGLVVAAVLLGVAVLVFAVLVLTSGVLAG